ncbi:RNA pyrophosphohydrolase [Oceaniglobus roseus]|uniref:RNA pyrophosphohydrolase n=1 Tax=Oceaniglobus roseus TaxID=1737570 RepID=UPI000C7F794D|nr:RNA pyrophosphohydrolase [Kandeliimicrobium roseum]
MTPEEIEKLPYRPCVGVMLVNGAGRVFVGARIDTPGAWQMPQGGIDPGEDPRDAALRELREETGVAPEKVEIEAETDGWIAYDLPHHLVPGHWKGRFRGQKQRWYLMRFRGEDGEIDISGPPPEFSEWQWMDKDRLLDSIVPFKRAVYQAVLAELGGRI